MMNTINIFKVNLYLQSTGIMQPLVGLSSQLRVGGLNSSSDLYSVISALQLFLLQGTLFS